MPKYNLFCDSCDQEFVVTFKGENAVACCPFCGGSIDEDWNVSDENEELD